MLQERMNTMQAQYAGALDRFRADMDRREIEAAKRETRQLGYTVGAVGVGVAILAAVIALAALFLHQSSQPAVHVPAPAPVAPVQPAPSAALPDAAAAEPSPEHP